MRIELKLLLLIFLIVLMPHHLIAQEGMLNKLLAPGPLSLSHQKLEKTDCLQCHAAGQGVPDSKCLECHKDIGRFVTAKKGFHGMATQSCKECHTEHKGRDLNTVAVDEKHFDHAKLTGYVLEGKHANIKCVECHKTKMKETSAEAGNTRYFGSQTSCVACHKKDDIHGFKGKWAAKDCNACHTLKTWNDGIKFEHLRDTGYKLVGEHAELKCANCHGATKADAPRTKVNPSGSPSNLGKSLMYQWPKLKQAQCLACHAGFHDQNLSQKFQGGDCTKCHTQTKWKIDNFEHKVTGYPLRGKHAEVKCIDCHKQKIPSLLESNRAFRYTGLKSQCLSCHKDYHHFGPLKLKGFGVLNACQACHNDTSWKQADSFDHFKATKYPLDGEHEKLDCLSCHIQKSKAGVFMKSVYLWPKLKTQTCEACHKSPHVGEFSQAMLKKACTECHVTSGWYNTPTGKKFDHSQTRFALTGAHIKTTCAECHGPRKHQIYKFKSFADKFCIDCHKDIHGGQFTNRLNTTRCAECHTTENFKERLPFDHNKTSYALTGAHKTTKCEECHVPTKTQVQLMPPNVSSKTFPTGQLFVPLKYRFPNLKASDCTACHADYHQGQLSRQCLDCHSDKSWKEVKFDHDLQSSYQLRDSHALLKCSECHKPISGQVATFKNTKYRVIRYKPISSDCITCHKDVHNGNFGKKCQECHTERNWKITKDFHKNFTLTGVHYSLNCAECHRDGMKLSGLSQNCQSCHAKDDIHSGTLPRCNECHRQQFWEVGSFKHSLTRFPLRGTHRTLDCFDCHKNGTYKGLSSTCASCHLSDALAVTSPVHSGFSNLMTCNACHFNQFSFR